MLDKDLFDINGFSGSNAQLHKGHLIGLIGLKDLFEFIIS